MLDSIQPAGATGSRFDGLFTVDSLHQPIWNTVLSETSNYLVVPTLGSIVPYWHLVIPRVASINMHEHLAARGDFDIREVLAPVLESRAVEQVIWFEHGPRFAGSVVGCGTDYAHLHVILDPPFEFSNFQAKAEEFTSPWQAVETSKAYRAISPDAEYYAFGNYQKAFVSQIGVRRASQMFRKIIAELVGKREQWDYRDFPHESCVRSTLQLWGKL